MVLFVSFKYFTDSTFLQIQQLKFHSENSIEPTVSECNNFRGIWICLYCNEGSNICSYIHVYITDIICGKHACVMCTESHVYTTC